MQSTLCEMLGWMKLKLESRLLGEIPITSDMQMTPPLCQRRTKESLLIKVKEASEKVEVDIFFWNSLAFSMIQRMLAISSLVPLSLVNPGWTSGSSRFVYWYVMVTHGKGGPLRRSLYWLFEGRGFSKHLKAERRKSLAGAFASS